MDKAEFQAALEQNAQLLQQIQRLAHEVHASVNQHYDKNLPYSVHLDMVADNVKAYGAEVCERPEDVVPMLFGAWFHDSIEDARLTYNNVHRMALQLMDERQALLATEIVYALTNEKGRNRAERANDRYYAGIRATPYAPLAKMADRLANVTYSCSHSSQVNQGMRHVYASENPHFVGAITGGIPDDPRHRVPKAMLDKLDEIISPPAP